MEKQKTEETKQGSDWGNTDTWLKIFSTVYNSGNYASLHDVRELEQKVAFLSGKIDTLEKLLAR